MERSELEKRGWRIEIHDSGTYYTHPHFAQFGPLAMPWVEAVESYHKDAAIAAARAELWREAAKVVENRDVSIDSADPEQRVVVALLHSVITRIAAALRARAETET